MKRVLFGLAALPFLASVAWAGVPLSDQQMDKVVAGGFSFVEFGLSVPCKPPPPCAQVPTVPIPTVPIPCLSPEGKV
jgi:hypothetical protein